MGLRCRSTKRSPRYVVSFTADGRRRHRTFNINRVSRRSRAKSAGSIDKEYLDDPSLFQLSSSRTEMDVSYTWLLASGFLKADILLEVTCARTENRLTFN